MTSNNQLPRLDNNVSNRNIFMGGSQIVVGIICLLISISFWVFQRIVLDVFFSADTSPLSIARWILLIVGTWFLCDGSLRLTVNSTYKRLINYLGNENITIEHLAELLGDTTGNLLKSISILSQRKYWGTMKVSDKAIEIHQMRMMPSASPSYKINAGEGMRFILENQHEEIPHPVIAVVLVALAVMSPLLFNDLLAVIFAIALSFPLRKVFKLLMPKKPFLSYNKIPEFVPKQIQLELSGNEQADELINLGEKHLNQLQEISRKINDDKLKATIGEISKGLNQMTDILKEKPEKHRQVRQTLDYSIPTAIKLYYKYIELDAQPVKGENIIQSMKKIHEMSDLVATTFARELNSLYQDQTLDIEVDVEVMRNMLQQESIDLSPIMDSLNK